MNAANTPMPTDAYISHFEMTNFHFSKYTALYSTELPLLSCLVTAVIVLLQSAGLKHDNTVFADALYSSREKGLKDRYSGENSDQKNTCYLNLTAKQPTFSLQHSPFSTGRSFLSITAETQCHGLLRVGSLGSTGKSHKLW